MTEEVVEVPLDSQYLTDEGMYMAGYLWGRHIRSPGSAPKNAPEIFLRGVEDGFGDGLATWRERDETISHPCTNCGHVKSLHEMTNSYKPYGHCNFQHDLCGCNAYQR